MRLSGLLPALEGQATLTRLIDDLNQAGGPQRVLSCISSARPIAVAALYHASQRPLLLVTARPAEARRYQDELCSWLPGSQAALLFPETDALPYDYLAHEPDKLADRLTALRRLCAPADESAPALVVASVRAVLDLLMPTALFRASHMVVKPGDSTPLSSLVERWVQLGYEPGPIVDQPGLFSRRGGIVDVYPPGGTPLRIDFWGDEIDSVRSFDPATQRSVDRLPAGWIGPAHEVLAAPLPVSLDVRSLRAQFREPFERDQRLLHDAQPFRTLDFYRGFLGAETLLDYLPPGAILVVEEPEAVQAAAGDFVLQVEHLHADLLERGEIPPGIATPYRSWQDQQRHPRPDVARLRLTFDPDAESLPFEHAPKFGGSVDLFLESVTDPSERSGTVVVSQQVPRLTELLAEHGIPAREVEGVKPGEHAVMLAQGLLREGWVSDELGARLFTDTEIFGWTKQRRAAQPRRSNERAAEVRETFLADLKPGETVVHVDHGIGRYLGMVESRIGFTPEQSAGLSVMHAPPGKAEFLLLEYAQGDKLYVPVSQADRVSRYVGAGEVAPGLTRLGTGEWARAKARVRRSVRDIAAELMDLYGARQAVQGHRFPPDSAWQLELEGSFPFEETHDQALAIRDVKADMEAEKPMDRLLVGDVGFGKTEVALRAAFKAVQDGQQVAVLVPTTVLAQQHYQTFRDRLGAFPVKVEMLSRFRTDREQRDILKRLADGSIDICIGTHRLVQTDVRFKALGLVVIDEEQRFGVVHKERLKQLRKEVDVLTLTATPIPRTLHMGLIGVRDMSVLETAPEARLPIRTYVAEYDDGQVTEAILREIDRGGQVFFVHNRVQGIELLASKLRKLVPEARIAIGHGQMAEDELERTMLAFAEGEYDVLVCTTIIESGLDIPNANTLIVNQAHRFGLAQLYQLRGRVGRGPVRAYAYFLYARDLHLTEIAHERLQTILEATELGAGMRIAMKDLEIRGAGNLLGAAQSGHISAVGFDLYTKLLAEQVELLKARARAAAGEAIRLPAEALRTSIDLPLAAFLPPEYATDDAVRLRLYQRLAGVQGDAELAAQVAELEDRFGALPEAAQNLVYLTSLRLRAAGAGVQEISANDREIVVRFDRMPRADTSVLSRRAGVPLSWGSNQLRFARLADGAWMGPLYALLEALDQPADARTDGQSLPERLAVGG